MKRELFCDAPNMGDNNNLSNYPYDTALVFAALSHE